MEAPEPTPSIPPANRTPLPAKGTPPSSSSSSSSLSLSVPLPRPLEALHEMGTPPFLVKTFEMVEDPATDAVVSWGRARNSFVVWDYCKLAADVLPRYFKHGNFCSFVRQLNTYGFKKVDPDRWEFANEGFLAGQKHLLKTIQRRRNSPKNPHRGGGTNNLPRPVKLALESEIQSLKIDKDALMLEVAKLRQHHQASLQELLSIEERLKGTEKKQHLMLGFLAKVVRSPSFVEKLVLQNEQKKALTGHGVDPMGFIPKKRRLPCSNSAENLQKAQSEIETLLFRTPIQDVGAYGTEDSSWEGMLNTEEEVASEVVEDLATSSWAENVQGLVDQMGFLTPKQCKSI